MNTGRTPEDRPDPEQTREGDPVYRSEDSAPARRPENPVERAETEHLPAVIQPPPGTTRPPHQDEPRAPRAAPAPPRRPRAGRPQLVTLLVVLLLVLAIGMGLGYALGSNGNSTQPEASSTSTPTPASGGPSSGPPGTEPASTGSSPLPATSGAPTAPATSTGAGQPAPGGSRTDLDLSGAVSKVTCTPKTGGMNVPWRTSDAILAKKAYPVAFSDDCYQQDSVGSLDFLVPTGITTLSGVAGIEDHSPITDAHVKVSILSAAGQPLLPPKTIAYGQSWAFSLPVGNLGRIRLQMEATGLPGIAYTGQYITVSWAELQFSGQ
jgi:hypothetical protein